MDHKIKSFLLHISDILIAWIELVPTQQWEELLRSFLCRAWLNTFRGPTRCNVSFTVKTCSWKPILIWTRAASQWATFPLPSPLHTRLWVMVAAFGRQVLQHFINNHSEYVKGTHNASQTWLYDELLSMIIHHLKGTLLLLAEIALLLILKQL